MRRECGEGEKASEQEEVVEIRKEKKDAGATVETIELREEGCREILTRDQLRPSQEDDLWSDDDWLTDLMFELKPPQPSSRVSPEKGPSPEVALDKGAEEVRRENENRETEVERDERESRDEKERSVEREKSEEIELGEDEDQDLVAGLCGENRNFIAVQLGGQTYKALFDPGAMLSLVGSRVAECFEDRLEDSSTAVQNVTRGITRVMGVLNVMLEIDHIAKPLPMKALHNLDQEIILGMDFCKLYDVDTQLGRGVWRVREGRWRPFAKTGEEERSVIHAECAGISELLETSGSKWRG